MYELMKSWSLHLCISILHIFSLKYIFMFQILFWNGKWLVKTYAIFCWNTVFIRGRTLSIEQHWALFVLKNASRLAHGCLYSSKSSYLFGYFVIQTQWSLIPVHSSNIQLCNCFDIGLSDIQTICQIVPYSSNISIKLPWFMSLFMNFFTLLDFEDNSIFVLVFHVKHLAITWYWVDHIIISSMWTRMISISIVQSICSVAQQYSSYSTLCIYFAGHFLCGCFKVTLKYFFKTSTTGPSCTMTLYLSLYT